MCGISGVINSEILNKDIDVVKYMSNIISHRGPDETSNLIRDKIFVEFKRLSIVGVKNGSQPFLSENKNVAVFVNGEIYNFKEIKSNLLKLLKFKTDSDCEVILHLYLKFGIDFLKEIRGMYLILIYDYEKRKIFFIRDRIGEKPIYFLKNDKKLTFCSEIKGFSFLKDSNDSFINYDAIYRYLVFQYFLEPETPFKNIFKLPSGSYMEINLDNLDFNIKEYWTYENSVADEKPEIELSNQFEQSIKLLAECSDVPISVSLSGGIDSCLVCSVLKKNNINFTAFHISYEGSIQNDDTRSAERFCRYLNIPLNKINLSDEEVKKTFLTTCFNLDEPIADLASIGYNAIFKTINKNGKKVVIQGHGVDELFWGYEWVKKIFLAKKNIILKFFLFLIYKIKINEILFNKDFLFSILYLKFFFKKDKNYFIELNNFLNKSFSPSLSPQNNIVKSLCKTYLQSNGITQGERLSMANSIELRLPYIDYRLIENIFYLREYSYLRNDFKLSQKYFFKQIVKIFLPLFITNRKKRGFSPPARKWFNIIFKEYGFLLKDGLLVKLGIISNKNAHRMSKGPNYIDYFTTNTPMCYKYLILEIWFKKFFGKI
jgi:asparagine synthase (glutamine-hydrolysing)